MTEVRVSPSGGGKGMFATQAFSKGSLILEESSPVVKLAPLSDEESQQLYMKWMRETKESSPPSKSGVSKKGPKTLRDMCDPPASIPDTMHGTFRGMVQAGICWMQREGTMSEADKGSILDLCRPTEDTESDSEKETMKLAKEATNYIKAHLPDSKEFDDWSELQEILLIWAYNAFEGGRIYVQISRVNHDCNPNAIIQADEDAQRVVAAMDIAVDDEISISYLGLFLYAERSARQKKLKMTKYFDCQCQRCKQADDVAGLIPCPTCHPRELPQQALDEDVQYDDEQNVNYVTAGNTSKCDICQASPSDNQKLQVVMKNVTSKVVAYLDKIGGTSATTKGLLKDDEQDDEEEDTTLEEHVGLANAIMGDRHWTTNLLKLIHLDRRLSYMSQSMLTTQELPETGDVAEAIDCLQRLERFVQSLGLMLDKGHLLGDTVIGVARMLVSLGDIKSQKYGAEWLDKISEYVDKFESEGRQKVVTALKVAWTKHEESDTSAKGPVKKRLKSS